MKEYYIYIMTNPSRTTLYVGVTNNLERRARQHQQKQVEGFTKKYNCTYLVYYEATDNAMAAIEREKQIKGWTRRKKESLIDGINPNREDLSASLKMTGGER